MSTITFVDTAAGDAKRRKKDISVSLFEALINANAIEIVTDPMYRGVGMSKLEYKNGGHPGHWWALKKKVAENYAPTFDPVQPGTIFVGNVKRPLLFVKFKNVFNCGNVEWDVEHDDKRVSTKRISNPTLKQEFEEFANSPFLKELRRLMMLADDNIASDDFFIHKSSGLKLDKKAFAGISFMCDGDPDTVGDRSDEYWLIDPVQSFETIELEDYFE